MTNVSLGVAVVGAALVVVNLVVLAPGRGAPNAARGKKKPAGLSFVF
ncbi:MAG: hypothetical protein IPI67_26170 [Myxococcales bacterium]|nr:hypothetical protein [Myxococcales bacterium]